MGWTERERESVVVTEKEINIYGNREDGMWL